MPVNCQATLFFKIRSGVWVKSACTANLTLNQSLGEKRLIWAINQMQRKRKRQEERRGWRLPEINSDTLDLLAYWEERQIEGWLLKSALTVKVMLPQESRCCFMCFKHLALCKLLLLKETPVLKTFFFFFTKNTSWNGIILSRDNKANIIIAKTMVKTH